MSVVGVILAAGSASRFGAIKVLAALDGRPMLQHVLDRLGAAGLERLVVVLGDAADQVENAIAWPPGAHRLRNPHPEGGLAGSLRIGMEAARRDGDPQAILIALGDQPRVAPAVVRALIDAPADRPVVVPRYPGGANPNPVLLRPPAYDLVDAATGDRGLGPLLRAHPELVREVPVSGDNPDVDTPGDLDRIRAARSRVP